jgi:phenylacetate-CoA ligase
MTRAGALHDAVEASPERWRELVHAQLPGVRAGLWASPFWRDALRRRGGAPSDLGSIDDLAHWPTLDRQTWAGCWADLVISPADPSLTIERSSGSTGAPVPVPRDAADRAYPWAVLEFLARMHGVCLPRIPRVALVDDLPLARSACIDDPLLGGLRWRVATREPDAAQRLRAIAPDVIFTDPAGLGWLLDHPLPSTRITISSAQHLGPWLRSAYGLGAQGPLIDLISTTETGPIAWSCPRVHDRFHVLSPDVLVESDDRGQLRVSRLRAGATALLLLEIGDRGRVAWIDCACGCRGPTIIRFEGRHPSWFRRPDGSRVDAWALAPLFRWEGVDRFVVHQVAFDRFEVATTTRSTRLHTRLEEALRTLGFEAPNVCFAADRAPVAGTKATPFRSSIAAAGTVAPPGPTA